jgi:hypothetical protein
MRELPFGARISEAFVKKLKWDTAVAETEAPGTLPCLCMKEGPWQTLDESKALEERIDLEKNADVPPINRVAPHSADLPASFAAMKKIFWALEFDACKYSPESTFEIDGVELHVPKKIQTLLQGRIIHVVSDEILVTGPMF